MHKRVLQYHHQIRLEKRAELSAGFCTDSTRLTLDIKGQEPCRNIEAVKGSSVLLHPRGNSRFRPARGELEFGGQGRAVEVPRVGHIKEAVYIGPGDEGQVRL